MKKILITGANSYIGMSVEKWLAKWTNKYTIDTISLRSNYWREISFAGYDVILHVAAVVHVKEKKVNEYFKINRDLAINVAQKAKAEGVRQFIFLSTMGVYGVETGYITRDTVLKPKTPYAQSKYEAEKLLLEIVDDNFNVAILRPPIVYGNRCKGNYQRLADFAVKTPIFPKINNKRSMIYIDNLCEFIRLIIDDYGYGVFFPQNYEYVNTSEMVRCIAEAHGKRKEMTKLFNPLLRLLKVSMVNKVFGNLVYDKSMSKYESNYNVCSFRDSIFRTEGVRK